MKNKLFLILCIPILALTSCNKEDKKKAAKHMLFYYGHMPFGKARPLDKWLWSTEVSSDGKVTRIEKTEYDLAS